ncbi:MAG TPA: hypothetical protein PK264_18535 [Hyphomicrobiaceae bacterium]|nr:hypothetical protein [Hyphomicrobiaceae bacterium]
MKALTTTLALATAAGALSFASVTTEPAHAASHYAMVCLSNSTTANIKFTWKEGNGASRTAFIAPGSNLKWTYRYAHANDNRSPRLVVSYDADARATNFTQHTHLERYATVGDTCGEAKRYAFQYEPANRNFIRIVVLN